MALLEYQSRKQYHHVISGILVVYRDPPNDLEQTGTSGQPVSGGQPWVTSGGPLNATAASTWTALATCYNPLLFLVLSLLSDNLFVYFFFCISLVMPLLLS